ncbi:Serine palmitoyltransferase 1 [Frankliniella fusca]|uniref:Serine palmitoyltransferase 1 n=1 Tax=Frankliniella fusca TaxID=407009 RepID=A0AAE1LJD3_9NEOP|nr:Serine palmitoyltransferase 1 [Frankliniella fusca]
MSSYWLPTSIDGFLGEIKEASLLHFILEGFLVAGLIWFIFRKSYKSHNVHSLSKEEEEKIISEWIPEPLVASTPLDHPALKPLVVTGKAGHYIDVNGQRCLNLATHNYLSFVDKPQVEERAIESIRKYGVGSCGPRGFYGTVDVHLELEEKLAKFMGMEEACVYAYGFSTVASAIPAYAKRSDIIFVDEQVNFAIQKGLDASRSRICYFKHNDVKDLERLMLEFESEAIKNPRKAKVTRRFLVIEGIYMNTGNICPLPALLELAHRFKCRTILDENVSFGTLGETGRGVTEFYNVNREDVDLIVGSMEWALGSIGGFCVGSSFIVEHQRLSGLGYCFSASLPPLLTAAAMASLEEIEKNPGLLTALQEKCKLVHEALTNLSEFGFSLSGHVKSPVKHLYLINPPEDMEKHRCLLHDISQYCIKNGVAIVPASYLDHMEAHPHVPSLRITVNVDLTPGEVEATSKLLQKASSEFSLS